MAIQDRGTIRNWFRRGLKPTQAQFWDTWDSFWHKMEQISIDAIDGLRNILNSKADITQVENALSNKANKDHLHNINEVRGLQDELDALSSVAAIRGSVDTFAKLQDIDANAAKYVDGDGYIVERDETRDNLSTLYVLSRNGIFYTWVFTGDWATNAGATRLTDLQDTSIVNLKTGQVLKFDGTRWINIDIVFTVTPNDSRILVKNNVSDGFTLPAATTAAAGVMTAEDRVKMIQLFDGSMLDSQNTKGFHKHNYLELGDLPPTVSLEAKNYAQFKTSLERLRGVVNKGGFGEIVQTGEWVINDNTVHDLSYIVVKNPAMKRITVSPAYSFQIKGRVEFELLYIGTSTVQQENFTVLKVPSAVTYDFVRINRLIVNNGTGQNINSTIPVIDISHNVESAFYLRDITIQKDRTLPTQVSNFVIKHNRPSRIIILENMIPEVVFDFVFNQFTDDTFMTIDDSFKFRTNIALGSRLRLLNQTFVNLDRSGNVPAPAGAQKTQYHFLNALGEWVDIRTLN